MSKKILYLCDAKKNVNCKKHTCLYNGKPFPREYCMYTTQEEYALRDKDGKIICQREHTSFDMIDDKPKDGGLK